MPSSALRTLASRSITPAARDWALRAATLLLTSTLCSLSLPTGTASAAAYHATTWPNGVVPFSFHGAVTEAQQAVAQQGMVAWEQLANVDFRERTFGDAWGIEFHQSGLQGVSWVGLIGVDGIGFNPLSLITRVNIGHTGGNATTGAWAVETIIHELAHILGFVHEQNRHDRDNSVRIEEGNVTFGPLLNFNFWIDELAETYGEYDFGSIMQYDQCSFSTCEATCAANLANCRTITVLPPNNGTWQNIVGTATVPSAMDARVMSFLYAEPDWRFVDDNDGTLNPSGAFLDPWSSLQQGASQTPLGGTLFIQPGTYAGGVTLNRNIRVEAPLGGVTIGE